MAGKVLNITVLSPFKLRSGLTGKYHAICHYSYNFPLGAIGGTSNKKRFNVLWISNLTKNNLSFNLLI